MVIRHLFTIHIRNQLTNNGINTNDKEYLKLQPTKNLHFNPEKIDRVGAEFNGGTIQRYQYTVTESKSGNV
jgi:hypothetical protein